MRNLSHTVKADQVTTGIDPKTCMAKIHRAGCGHESKLDNVQPFDLSRICADDYFEVAPCAR